MILYLMRRSKGGAIFARKSGNIRTLKGLKEAGTYVSAEHLDKQTAMQP